MKRRQTHRNAIPQLTPSNYLFMKNIRHFKLIPCIRLTFDNMSHKKIKCEFKNQCRNIVNHKNFPLYIVDEFEKNC